LRSSVEKPDVVFENPGTASVNPTEVFSKNPETARAAPPTPRTPSREGTSVAIPERTNLMSPGAVLTARGEGGPDFAQKTAKIKLTRG
jgi:hypothetical protein